MQGSPVGARSVAAALLSSALMALAAPAHSAEPAPGNSSAKWSPWAELGGYYGTDDASRAEGVFWAPLWQSPLALFFADTRFKLFEEDVQEGNFALGYRQMLASGWNLGAWSGLDARSTQTDNTFWQVSGGVEALSANWDLRVNGYMPLTDPQGSPSLAEVQLEGNSIFMIGGQEVPLYGVDAEVGYRLFASPDTKPGQRHELRLYGGGFWFDADEALQEVAGPKARLEFRVEDVVAALPGSRLTLEAEYSHDDVREDRWEVGARLRLPFGGTGAQYAALTPQERRMTEGLERDTDIITAQSGQEPVEDALTNVDFDRVAYVNDGGSVTDTSNDAGDNTLIIAKGVISGAQQMQGQQTLQGGGATIQVRGLKSGTAANFTAPGSRPVLNLPGNAPNLTLLGDRTHATGFDIQGAVNPVDVLNDGIAGGGLDTVIIEQMRIVDTRGDGIEFGSNNRNVTIANTTIANAGGRGIGFFTGNSGVSITGTSITNVFNDGISFFSDNSNVTIAGTAIDGAQEGIAFGNNNSSVTISDAAIANATTRGVVFDSGNTDVTIAGTTITNTGSEGVIFDDDNSGITIAGTTITDVGLSGIVFDENNRVSITGTTITNAGDHGLHFDGTDNIVTLEKSTLAGTFVDDGISFTTSGSTISGGGNVAAGATFGGQFCAGGGGQTGRFVFDIGSCPP